MIFKYGVGLLGRFLQKVGKCFDLGFDKEFEVDEGGQWIVWQVSVECCVEFVEEDWFVWFQCDVMGIDMFIGGYECGVQIVVCVIGCGIG